MTFEQVGRQFIEHYYSLFDTNKRTDLGALYQPESMLSFEGEKFQGRDNIAKKIVSLPFQQVQHVIVTSDFQPTASNGIVIFVCGNLVVDGALETPMKFSQLFSLMPSPTGGFYVLNDMFRLNVG